MCLRSASLEEVELIEGSGPDQDEISVPFDSIRLLSYNIFIRMSVLRGSFHFHRSTGAQIHA